jgi:tetratricopeptide (TPR) repeat protein
MAPEQWLAAPDVDARADGFALGGVLVRALTGELPYEWSDFLARTEGRPAGLAPGARLSALAPERPAALAALVVRMLSFDRGERPADARAVSRELDRIDAGSLAGTSLSVTRRAVWIAVADGEISLSDEAARSEGGALVFGRGEGTSVDLAHVARALASAARDRAIVVGRATLEPGESVDAHVRALREKLPRSPGLHVAADALGTLPLGLHAESRVAESAGGFVVRIAAVAPLAPAPIVGREAELSALDQHLASGRAGAVWLWGPAGIGKTALLDAWTERAAATVVRATASRGDRAHALRPLLALARAHGGGPAPDERSKEDPVALAIHEAAAALLLRGPLVLAIDDAHFLDAASVRVLRDLLRAHAGRPFLVVAAGREALDGVAADLGAEPLALRALDLAHVEGLARAAGVDAAHVERLHRRSGGNPLFVRQLLALGVSRSRDETGDWPADVEAAVQARLDALPREHGLAWRVASAFFGTFRAEDLAALGVEDAAEAVRELSAREILAPHGDSLRFTADVLREVAYALLPASLRAEIHARIARSLEREQPADWARVAEQWERASEASRAGDAWARAAIEAAPTVPAGVRAEWASRALARGRGGTDRVALELLRVDSLELAGRLDEALGALAALEPTLDGADDRARALVRRGVLLQRKGRGSDARAVLAEAARAAEGAGPETLAVASGKHGVALAYAGDIERAHAELARAERIVLLRAPSLRADAAVWRAQVAGMAGDLGDRRNAYWAAVELYREGGDLRLAAGAGVNLADSYNQLGAYDEAERALETALAECRALGVRVMAGYALLNLGYARAQSGRPEAAHDVLDEAAVIAEETGEKRLAAFVALYRARAVLVGSRPEAALALLAPLARASDAAMRILALTTVARARLELGDGGGALEAASEATGLLDALGGLEEGEAELHLVHARALERAGRAAEAAAVLARGAAFVRALARRIGDPEWRARILEDVPAHRELLGSVSGRR